MRILTKIIACTTDNASNNDTLMKSLESVCQERSIDFTTKNNHVRCLAHIINLAAQAALSSLKVGYVKNENVLLNDTDEITEVIPKVRYLEKLARQCEAAHLPNKELISDVKTRWNSTYAMIERSCELRKALDNTVTADRDLRKWELVDSEWKLLEKIKNLLYIFSRATNHISHSRFPTISNFVPVYNWLMDKIEDLQTNKNTNEVIKIVAKNAMEKIQKYYHYTSALVYNISTVLDPRLKLQYYKDNDWEEEYITEIRTSIFNIYNTQYAPSLSMTIESDRNSEPNDNLFHHIYKKDVQQMKMN
ncbi:unnamed protein product [Rhizophagus irregularis]|nr:unnamed protein product [Rhizophagus irregularis]